MAANISSIDKGSAAELAGIKPGDKLISINRHNVSDVLDYMYYSSEQRLKIVVLRDAQKLKFTVNLRDDEGLGLNFDTYLIDKQRHCKNKCVFCFIDQLPKGLRESLYFKDDDARLSFLLGNYITLTNLDSKEIRRIAQMRISPINISVHTTDPALRVKMMANPAAAKIMDVMRTFAKAGITMNCQIVLCKGLNDGKNLARTMDDLSSLYPYVASVSIVPVGLTKYRQGLYPLESFSKSDCVEVLDLINSYHNQCRKSFGVGLFYPSDEFFINAGVELPSSEYYDGYLQLENGVGMMRSLLDEVDNALENCDISDIKIQKGLITGVLAAPFMQQIIQKVKQKYKGLDCKVYPIKNNFFGPKITVSGLITGTDIIDQLKGQNLPITLLLPSNMLRSEKDMFLDSMTLKSVMSQLGVKLKICSNDGYELVNKLTQPE